MDFIILECMMVFLMMSLLILYFVAVQALRPSPKYLTPDSKKQNSPENNTPYSGHSSRSHKLTKILNPKYLMYSKNQNSQHHLLGPNSEPKIFNRVPRMNNSASLIKAPFHTF